MNKVRHTVEKIRPDIPQSFDQQFWPVLMAICVVCSIAAGAIVTLVHGPWMWGSLLVLPAFAALAIVLLFRLDDNILRRSLQIAILGSLAIHLLILLISSLLVIFGTTIPDQTVQVAKAPTKKIVVSNKMKQLVFQQSQKHETPDTPIEPEKTQTTTRTQPQPVPVVEKEKTNHQQVVKKRVDQPDAAKLERQLSQLRRNSRDVKPVSTQGMALKSSAAAEKSSAQADVAPSKTDVARESSESKSKVNKEESATASASSQAKATSKRRTSDSTIASSSKATARIRKSETKIPKIAAEKPVSQLKQTAQKSVKTQSSSVKLNRNPVTQTAARKETVKPANLAKQPVAKSTARRESNRSSTTVRSEPVKTRVARNVASNTPTTKVNVEPVRQTAAAKNRQRSVRPKRLAISRSTGGIAGAGRAKNLDRVMGGQPSPVSVASDSSSRRQSNRMSENISLSSLQRANQTDSGNRTESQRVLRAETTKWAKRSGSSQPSSTTLQAAAANVDSSVSQSRGQTATEKGTAMLDMGPTKVVPEVTANRRSGGGMPELSDSMAKDSQPSAGRNSNVKPSQISPVVVRTGQDAAAESSQLSTEQGQMAELVDRSQSTFKADSNATKEMAQAMPSGLSDSVAPTTSFAERRNGSDSMSSNLDSDQISESLNEQSGNSRSRVAQAPAVNRQVEMGSDQPSRSTGDVALDSQADDASSSSIVQRATESMTGSGMLGTSTRVVAASMAGLPLFAPESTERNQRREMAESVAGADSGFSSDSSRNNNSLQPKIRPELAGRPASSDPNLVAKLTAEDATKGNLERQSAQPMPADSGAALDLVAPEGPIGFADIPSRRVGKLTEASTISQNLSPTSNSRFKRTDSGGAPAVTPNVTIAKKAFRKRNPAALANSGPSTEAAIELGLEFLARHQLGDGSWTLGQFDIDDPLFQSQLNSDTAATGLALLAFQGAGYNHREYKYAAQVKRAIDWLIANQAAGGGLYVESDKTSNDSSRLYSHAIAALALTEAYGMTQDPAIRDATQKALDYISDTQDPKKGGWRYFAQRRMRSSDTSVTGWMMMALQSGRLAGLKTKQSTLDQIEAWLRVAQSPESESEFRYNPYAVDSSGMSRMHGRKASITMTSVGLLMRVYSGWGPSDPRFQKGAEVLLQQLPSDQDSRVRDTYYWYYATQVMKHAGGEFWEQWRGALHPLLTSSQVTSGEMRGSWHPYKPVPDRWAPQGGRIYVTTMNLLSLEVRYRLLPLYEKTID